MKQFIGLLFLATITSLFSCKKDSSGNSNSDAIDGSATINKASWIASSQYSFACEVSGGLSVVLGSKDGSTIRISLSSLSIGNYTIASGGNSWAAFTSSDGNTYNVSNGSVSIESIGSPSATGYVSVIGKFAFSALNINNNSDTITVSDGILNVIQSQNLPKVQTWNLTITDDYSGDFQSAIIMVTPGVYGTTFSETANSPGIWIFIPGTTCEKYRLNIGGYIGFTISPGGNCTSTDSWTFFALTGAGCLCSSLGSGSGHSNSCKSSNNFGFSSATEAIGSITMITRNPYIGTSNSTASWRAELR
jgi:hypothetical protein